MTASAAAPTLSQVKRPQTHIYEGDDLAAACVVVRDGTRTIFLDSSLTKNSRPMALKILKRRASRLGNHDIVIVLGWLDDEFCRALDSDEAAN